ncbi:receptor-interacting serine/threonine-protein kinase 3 [Aplochiton taeniatus]
MAQSCQNTIGDDILDNWQVIGSGGFGQIHKARHKNWGTDVAIKLLHYDDGNSLMREAALMQQGASPHVLRVMGVYKGCPPGACHSSRLGLVMEFMERGSLASLQDALSGLLPWPLVFRLAHQVAQGMTYLHQLSPPLLHLDLKPSNVLLDDSLNAKLTDFGLSTYFQSHSSLTKKHSGEEGGTTSYMPPEAFYPSYKATRASDIYSYGILLWSIVTDCSAVTETLYQRHRQHIIDAVQQVLQKMDPGTSALRQLSICHRNRRRVLQSSLTHDALRIAAGQRTQNAVRWQRGFSFYRTEQLRWQDDEPRLHTVQDVRVEGVMEVVQGLYSAA